MSQSASNMFSEYIMVVVIAMSGGIVSYSQQVWIKKTKSFAVGEMIADIFASGFSGVIMFLLCNAMDISPSAKAAAVGIAGHMGTRFLYGLHGVVCSYIKCKKEKDNE